MRVSLQSPVGYPLPLRPLKVSCSFLVVFFKEKKRERGSSVTGEVLLGCPLAVLVVLVFYFGCLVVGHYAQSGLPWRRCGWWLLAQVAFFLRLPIGQYGPVSQLSRSEERCTGPFNWGEAHCAGEKVKRKIGPFQWKSLWIKPNSKTTKGRGPPRQPGTPRPGSQVHGPKRKTTTTNKRLHKQILVRLNVLDLQWTVL